MTLGSQQCSKPEAGSCYDGGKVKCLCIEHLLEAGITAGLVANTESGGHGRTVLRWVLVERTDRARSRFEGRDAVRDLRQQVRRSLLRPDSVAQRQ